MFIAALHTIARTWKQPKCPSTEEWMKKMWYIHAMEYYSAIKKNEIGSFVEMWMDLQTVIQSEVCQIVLNIFKCPFLISALNLSEPELNHLHTDTEPCFE